MGGRWPGLRRPLADEAVTSGPGAELWLLPSFASRLTAVLHPGEDARYVILECERQWAEASPSEPRTGPPGPGARWKPKPAVRRLPPQPHHFPVRGVAARGPRVGWWTQPQPRAVCGFVVRGGGGWSELSGQDGFLAPAPCPRQALQIHRHVLESFAMQRSSSLHRPNGLACEPNPAGCPR